MTSFFVFGGEIPLETKLYILLSVTTVLYNDVRETHQNKNDGNVINQSQLYY